VTHTGAPPPAAVEAAEVHYRRYGRRQQVGEGVLLDDPPVDHVTVDDENVEGLELQLEQLAELLVREDGGMAEEATGVLETPERLR
jgi:hypothetical protein